MIRITNEIGGKKYELVPEVCICEGCAFVDQNGYCILDSRSDDLKYYNVSVCGKLHGIWKDVKE